MSKPGRKLLQASRPDDWKTAPRPNYSVNADKKFPYSELPLVSEYNLYKLDELTGGSFVDLVDFWGEGRIREDGNISGFVQAYNINHEYQLVSNGPSSVKGRKIPNRIPTKDYDSVSVAAYVKDNSVTSITVMGAPINRSSAQEISRLIRKDLGQIIVYGFDPESSDIRTLEEELDPLSFYSYPNYELQSPFNEITLFSNHLAYVNATFIADNAIKAVNSGSYAQARQLVGSLNNHDDAYGIQKVVDAAAKNYRIFPFGYELNRYKSTANVVASYFPQSVRFILLETQISITNVQFNMPLKVGWNSDGEGDRTAYGGDAGRGIEASNKDRFYWRLDSIDGGKHFSITNARFNMPLKVGWNADGEGDRTAFGGDAGRGIEPSNKNRFYWRLEPIDGGTYFSITNARFNMPLKVGWNADGEGDRTAFGGDAGRGIEPSNKNRFYWRVNRT